MGQNNNDLTGSRVSSTYQRIVQTANGYFYDGFGNTVSVAGGSQSQGFQGPQGVQGNQGNQGIDGSIGNQGAQGIQGITGDIGSQGQQGNQGIIGSTGSQGLQGVQGNQGAIGNQGVQGPQGNQGITGSTGSQGSQGNQGNQGRTGSTGNQGNQGVQGPLTSIGVIEAIGGIFDGQGGVISTSAIGYLTPPYDYTINSWTVNAAQSGSIQFDIKNSTGNSIINTGNKPKLTSAQNATASIAGWSQSVIPANTLLKITIDSVSSITWCSCQLNVTRN